MFYHSLHSRRKSKKTEFFLNHNFFECLTNYWKRFINLIFHFGFNITEKIKMQTMKINKTSINENGFCEFICWKSFNIHLINNFLKNKQIKRNKKIKNKIPVENKNKPFKRIIPYSWCIIYSFIINKKDQKNTSIFIQ